MWLWLNNHVVVSMLAFGSSPFHLVRPLYRSVAGSGTGELHGANVVVVGRYKMCKWVCVCVCGGSGWWRNSVEKGCIRTHLLGLVTGVG